MNIEKVLLEKSKQYYTELTSTHTDDEYFGTLPRYLIIEQYEAVGTEHLHRGALLKRWKYIDGELSVEPIDKSMEDNPRLGMYFRYAMAAFYANQANTKACIEILFGPRYGQGFEFDIVQNGDRYSLSNKELVWVS